jgi:hypothetical protein
MDPVLKRVQRISPRLVLAFSPHPVRSASFWLLLGGAPCPVNPTLGLIPPLFASTASMSPMGGFVAVEKIKTNPAKEREI